MNNFNLCGEPNFLLFLVIVKYFVNVLRILVPILLIGVSLSSLFKVVISGKEIKEQLIKLFKSVIASLVVFIIPTLINYFLLSLVNYGVIAESFSYCEKNANLDTIKQIRKELEEARNVGEDYDFGNIDIQTPQSTGGTISGISIEYNKKDPEGRCGKSASDYCVEIATVNYASGKSVKYYMGYQNNSGLLGGSCRSHAFTCGMNAVNDTKYSTLDMQNYMYSIGKNGVLKGKDAFNSAINHFNVPATAYFDETSISESISLAKKALAEGKPVIIFVAHSKCPDLAGSHHALLLLGYDNDGNVMFLDSGGKYPSAKKRNLEQLGQCMSNDSIARNWMRMIIYD